MKMVRALRGATTVDEDSKEQVVLRTGELLRQMIDRNQIDHADIISILFTATSDVHSEFPAAAARSIGLRHVPLLGSQEMDVTGAVPLCIRVLINFYSSRHSSELRHVYLEAAAHLGYQLPQ